MSNHSSSIPELSDNGIRYYQTYNESLSLYRSVVNHFIYLLVLVKHM